MSREVVQNLSRLRPRSSASPATTVGPNKNAASKEDTTSIPIPGTPFRLTAEGRLHVAVDLQELLTNQGIPGQLASDSSRKKIPKRLPRSCSTLSIFKARANFKTARVTSEPGSRTATTCYPRLPAGWKFAGASWKLNSGGSRHNSSKRRELARSRRASCHHLHARAPRPDGDQPACLSRHFACFPSRSSGATRRCLIPSCAARSTS